MGLACTDDLLARLAADMGLPDKTRLVRRVDIASYPRPDGDTGGEDLGAMCGLGGDGGPAKQPAYCGLIPCPSGVAAFRSSTGCSCGSAAGSFRVADMCLAYRCPDGQFPTPTASALTRVATSPAGLRRRRSRASTSCAR